MLLLLSHPDEDTLECYAMNRLPERQANLLEEHLLCCESCRVALTGLEEEIKVMCLALN